MFNSKSANVFIVAWMGMGHVRKRLKNPPQQLSFRAWPINCNDGIIRLDFISKSETPSSCCLASLRSVWEPFITIIKLLQLFAIIMPRPFIYRRQRICAYLWPSAAAAASSPTFVCLVTNNGVIAAITYNKVINRLVCLDHKRFRPQSYKTLNYLTLRQKYKYRGFFRSGPRFPGTRCLALVVISVRNLIDARPKHF